MPRKCYLLICLLPIVGFCGASAAATGTPEANATGVAELRALALRGDVPRLQELLNLKSHGVPAGHPRRQFLALEWTQLAATAKEAGEISLARTFASQALAQIDKVASHNAQPNELERQDAEALRAFLVENFLAGSDDADGIRKAAKLPAQRRVVD